MAFMQATAPIGSQPCKLLSADNIIPERHIVVATLRNAAPLLGLSAAVITTLDAMLSCLAPKRNHHTVFASNATLTFRRNGISDRTLRRHAATLQELGLLVRRDSPNGKRFTKHSKQEGKALRFGFDLTPLFDRLYEIADMAATAIKQRQHITYLRAKIRTAANIIIQQDANVELGYDALRTLRRKLSIADCEQLLEQLSTTVKAEGKADETEDLTTEMAASDGQFVRHHHKSNKEVIDRKPTNCSAEITHDVVERPITVPELLAACPEAAGFSHENIETIQDVIDHAQTLAPMIGISQPNYEMAQARLGELKTAATVWAILQFHEKITSVGAYFRSITTGTRSAEYSVERLIRRLSAKKSNAG